MLPNGTLQNSHTVSPEIKYGAAARFDFDNPQKWVTVPNVPLLDEHEMMGEDGRVQAIVDRPVLEEIARNNNAKVHHTGDPATLILGHTSDDPLAPEKPAKGFVTNYRVRPFRRDPNTGKTIYAIFGDYKVRPHNAHLIEEYPRRSVELWWHKRDIDPIAMLGGSSPERDLGAVIRHGRLNHVSLAQAPARGSVRDATGGPNSLLDEEVIRFSRRGNYTIETYSISPPRPRYRYDKNGKVEKVMHEFKHGELHSGSKHGPTVTNRDQALAIAMNEAGKSRYSEGSAMPGRYDESCGSNGKMKYGDDLAGTRDIGESDGADDYDAGDDGTPDDDFDSDGGQESEFDAKLGQSKIIKTLQSGIDQILQMLQGGQGGMPGEPGGAGEPPMDGMDDEMPPPGAGGDVPPGGDMGAAPGGQPGFPEGGGEGMPPEESESRRGMGEHPVQMSGTAFPGGNDVYTPMGTGGKSRSSYSRNGTPMNGTRTARNGRPVLNSREAALEQKVVRLERQRQQDRFRFARQEAQQVIADLEREGVLFGDTPETAARQKAARVEDLTSEIIYDQDMEAAGTPTQYARDHVEEIRQCYRRRPSDPAKRTTPPLSQYSRSQVDISGQKVEEQSDDEFMDSLPTDQDRVQASNMIAKNVPMIEVKKYMRKKYGTAV